MLEVDVSPFIIDKWTDFPKQQILTGTTNKGSGPGTSVEGHGRYLELRSLVDANLR
jgi:hypothetical protein